MTGKVHPLKGLASSERNDMDQNPTPLLTWLREASSEQRERLAAIAGTSVNYLYLLATCERKNPAAKLALAIEDGTRQLHEESGAKLPIVTVRTMATMCTLKDLQDGANA